MRLLVPLVAGAFFCASAAALPRRAERTAEQRRKSFERRDEPLRRRRGGAATPARSASTPPSWLARDGESRPSVGCGANATGPTPDPEFPDWFRFPMIDPVNGAIDRWFVLHVPPSYEPSRPTPLVFDIHGYTSNSQDQRERTGMDVVADEEQFIVVYPDGLDDAFLSNGNDEKGWNSGGTVGSPGLLGPTCPHPPPNASYYSCYKSCKWGPGHSPPGAGRGCYMGDDPPHREFARGCDSSTCVDDAHFLSTLLQELMSTMCIERRRVHATGFSNGAMMVYDLAMESKMAPLLGSIAPVAGAPMLGFLRDASGAPVRFYT